MSFCRGVNPHRTRAWLWVAMAVAGVLCACAGINAHAASFQPLEIVTKTGVQVFSVEMATTEEEKTTGLMYRKELPDGKGMLFDFSPEQQVSMWMKKHLHFARHDLHSGRWAHSCELRKTPSHYPPGIICREARQRGFWRWPRGTAQKYGIAPGDRVAHPLFNGP